MSYFDMFLPKKETDNIMLVREDKNKSAKKNILASSAETLLKSYAQDAKAKSAVTKPTSYTAEKKDSFLEGFNDPYGEKKDLPHQSLAQRMMSQIANPARQTPQSPMIKTEEPKYTFPFAENSKKNESTQKVEDDAFLEGFNDPYGEKKEEKEKNWLQTGLDWMSGILTVASLIPGWDTASNALQLLVDLGRGDYPGAVLDLVGIIPYVGEAADFAKYSKAGNATLDGIQAADKVADGIKAAEAMSDGIKIADDVADGAKAIDKAHDALKNADDFDSAASAIEKGSDTVKAFNRADAESIVFSSTEKQTALKNVNNLPEPIQKSAKSFYKRGSNLYNRFSIIKNSDNTYTMIMEKPGNVFGSKAVYCKVVDKNGELIEVYKETFDPLGQLVHRKEK